jgi:two-component system sensor histidine kinase EvgS
MDGLAATRKIRALEGKQNVEHCPIIMYTADTDNEVLDQVFQAGVDHCLYKPCTKIELLTVLSDFIDPSFDNQSVGIAEVSHINPLVDGFLEQFSTSIDDCRMHIDDHKFEALGEEIHKMLGTCSLVGASSMQVTLKKMKDLSNERNVEPSLLLALLAKIADQLQIYREVAKLSSPVVSR